MNNKRTQWKHTKILSLNADPDTDAAVEEEEEEEAAVEEKEDERISSCYRQSMMKLVQGIWGWRADSK